MLVEMKLATPEEVQQCWERWRKLADAHPDASFADVLVDHGTATRNQLVRIKEKIQEARDQQIPGYQILSKIGAGAMAVVFKGKQVSLDRIVAIKVLPKRLSENAEYVDLFYKEGQAAAKLNHPNIVQAIDVGEAGGYHYFVMEFVDGHTVYDDLAGGTPYSEAESLRITIQIARALEHAHARGLIHRDVKPKNIMITRDGTAKLADMGLARLTADKESAEAQAGRAYGTPYYMSPEQIRGAKDIDFRSDIYSLGATLYHMVTGRVPFEGDTPVEVMQRHLKESLTPPDHLNPELSAGLGEVVEVMMAKDRKGRYKSTADLLLDLEAIAAGEAPPQARRQIDAGVLSGLAHATEDPGATQTLDAPTEEAPSNLLTYVILLAAALAVSLLFNLVQLLAS